MPDDACSCSGAASSARVFGSEIVDRMRGGGNVWDLGAGRGQLVLPRVFGLCRGVVRALEMLEAAVASRGKKGQRLFLLGQIIHNPWVNDYFRAKGVVILSARELASVESVIGPGDCAVVPAFGVPLEVQARLAGIGCDIIDTSCGDVRRLWAWAQRCVQGGYGVLIFGTSTHDETVVTKSRLRAAGGRYVVVGSIEQARQFGQMISGTRPGEDFGTIFDEQATNSGGIGAFEKLAQVSQTTMLHDQTMEIRDLLKEAYALRFGAEGLCERLLFEPTVCRATQERQSAAVELCRSGCDAVIVVGGFGSSNSRHLYELARGLAPSFFIEGASALVCATELQTMDFTTGKGMTMRDWLPDRRPLRIGVLAGASSPEIVVGEVLQRLAGLIGIGNASVTGTNEPGA
jgi:4-hydroxy-3-methylbut-2-enyl diphosphate reductase